MNILFMIASYISDVNKCLAMEEQQRFNLFINLLNYGDIWGCEQCNASKKLVNTTILLNKYVLKNKYNSESNKHIR